MRTRLVVLTSVVGTFTAVNPGCGASQSTMRLDDNGAVTGFRDARRNLRCLVPQ
jgi:hypothetical protein